MRKVGPLMQLDSVGNPVNAPGYDWLCRSLKNLQDVEILILDPKSKFYGLVENDNNHNAAWINCLESLVARFGITVIFTHHESKALAGSINQASSRGGTALTDGCRWVANLRTLDAKLARNSK
jgi:RecA-family ATPase